MWILGLKGLIGESLRMIQIRISDARSLGSWYIK